MTTLRDRPAYRLTRHFFEGLFDLGFLSDAGTASFTRMVIGICACFLSFGLLLVRVFMSKYGDLMGRETPEPYREALLADQAFLIAVPMWIVAFVTVLVGHALFPDETDFRVLMALPVTRRLIFGTKVLALGLFAGLFILAAHAALLPLFMLMSFGPWTEGLLLFRAMAYWAASLLASGFAVLAVVAIQGLLVVYAPRGRVLAASTALRSVMLCGLVLSLPFVGRLPTESSAFSSGRPWLLLVPPAWFVGVERWLLGDSSEHLVRLAQMAGVVVPLVAIVAAASYMALYRRFDRVMLRPAEAPGRADRRVDGPRRRPRDLAHPVFTAIRTFTAITLRRSVLHQGVVVVCSAAGVGLVVNSVIGADLTGWLGRGGAPHRGLVASIIWAPLALMFVSCFAVRTALAVPIELRANWVFRMNEQDAARADQLGATVYMVRRLGVLMPALLMFPLHWLVLGSNAVVVLMVALLCGSLLVEILMRDWGRIPFTCSYLPGKGFVPQTILIGFISFVAFTTFGTALVVIALAGLRAALVLNALVLGVVLLMAARRRTTWKHVPLEFEDQLPTETNPLRLH